MGSTDSALIFSFSYPWFRSYEPRKDCLDDHGETVRSRDDEAGRDVCLGQRAADLEPSTSSRSNRRIFAASRHRLRWLPHRCPCTRRPASTLIPAKLASVATPLEATDEPLGPAVATWLLSAGGGNVDIVAAAKALILREPRQLCVLCGRDASRLAELCRQHPFVDLLLYPPPTGKDGFLATNSLLGFTALLTRAYTDVFGSGSDWREAVDCLEPLLPNTSAALEAWESATASLWTRTTTLVLHGPSTQVGAIDIESKFTEAALGHVQIADYRNFAHGRHHWLAKRSETSAVLAFISDADRALAERTLDLLPTDVPQARISFDGGRAPPRWPRCSRH